MSVLCQAFCEWGHMVSLPAWTPRNILPDHRENENSGEMNMRLASKRTIFGATGMITLCLLSVSTKTAGQVGQEPKPRMADEVFKNVQVLKGLPVDEFMDTMGMISSALGLNCLDCHTSDADKSWERFAADTTMKQTSRRMIQMVNALNKDTFR